MASKLAAFMLMCQVLAVFGSRMLHGMNCPPPSFDTVADFDIAAYIAAPWFVQQQLPLGYQPENQLFCVRAKYEFEDKNNPQKGIIVNNYSNNGTVNGPANGTSRSNSGSGVDLRAVPAEPNSTSPTAASKFLVGPKFLQTLLPNWRDFYGPYWVVAVGPSKDPTLKYDWAIITGGPPTTATEGGCVPRSSGRPDNMMQPQERGGFWLFSRKPVDPEATKAMRARAQELGLDVSVLADVKQEGCKYQGAV